MEATSLLTLDAHQDKSHIKSKFRFKSTPIEDAEPPDDAGLRFLRQQLLED